MFKFLLKVYNLLNSRQKTKFLQLQVLVFLMGLAEMVSVVSISPFIALVSNPDIIEQPGLFQSLYELSKASSPEMFILYSGSLALFILLTSSLVSMYTVWHLAMFANRVGTELGEKLYRHYLTRPWLFHTEHNSALLTQNISIETTRLTSLVLVSIMRLNARVVLVSLLGGLLFIINPLVALFTLLIFGLAYLALFKLVRSRLSQNSNSISKANQQRFILMSEAFGSIKDVLLMHKQKAFINRFNSNSEKLAYANGSNQALVEAPRFFMEMVTFSSVVALILYLYTTNDGEISMVLPLLSIYALAGFKMLPAFQQIYRSVGQIKGNMSSFSAIEGDLVSEAGEELCNVQSQLSLTGRIELINVKFTYPNKKDRVLDGLNLTVPALQTVGLVGTSGAGKSTVLDIILGLIKPEEGSLVVNGIEIDESNIFQWQNTLGFVSQQIYLSDRTLSENVAFGIPKRDIDLNRIKDVLNTVHLASLVSELPKGLDTIIGEQGVQLSGGQRQRLGIARALYHDPDILLFDEATSALDGLTEKAIMDAIAELNGKKTIFLIAHRLKTVKTCDIIYIIDKGRVVESGTYSSLMEHSHIFKNMAAHS